MAQTAHKNEQICNNLSHIFSHCPGQFLMAEISGKLEQCNLNIFSSFYKRNFLKRWEKKDLFGTLAKDEKHSINDIALPTAIWPNHSWETLHHHIQITLSKLCNAHVEIILNLNQQFPCFSEEEKSAYIDTPNKNSKSKKNANSMASMALLFSLPFGPTTAE